MFTYIEQVRVSSEGSR